MSGGVDSSVSALLLKQQGYEVIGVFIKTWQPDYIECTWKDDRLDAIRVAAQLDIPFITLDLEKEYKEGVVDYMINEYLAGRTPNPDIMCNKEIKFGAFYKYVKSIDSNAMIATGHYAATTPFPLGRAGDGMNLALSKAFDQSKDQVYFLAQIDRNILSDVIFPLGNMMKSGVREIAKKNNLYVANKKDSQGICMLGNISMKDFLKKEIPNANEVLFYTIGERLDFNINEKNNNINIVNYSKENINQGPYYVTSKNIKENTLYISNNKIENNKNIIYNIESWNYTSNIVLKEGDIYEGQTRYHGEIHKFKVIEYKEVLQIKNIIKYKLLLETIDDKTLMVSGQTIVLYDGDLMIGGGIIA